MPACNSAPFRWFTVHHAIVLGILLAPYCIPDLMVLLVSLWKETKKSPKTPPAKSQITAHLEINQYLSNIYHSPSPVNFNFIVWFNGFCIAADLFVLFFIRRDAEPLFSLPKSSGARSASFVLLFKIVNGSLVVVSITRLDYHVGQIAFANRLEAVANWWSLAVLDAH